MSAPTEAFEVASLDRLQKIGLQDRLRDFQMPSVLERANIKEIIRCSRVDMRRIDVELNRLREQTFLLTCKRHELNELSKQCTSLLSPIRKLPNEILSLVFVYCAEFNKIVDTSNGIYLTGQKLQSVCWKWRTLADSERRLWSNIYLHILHRTSDNSLRDYERSACNRVEHVVHRLLTRSNNSPLHMQFSVEDDRVFSNRVFSLVAAASHRWKSLVINVNLPAKKSGFDLTFMGALVGKIPLEDVKLTCSRYSAVVEGDLSVFESAPVLCSWHTTDLYSIRDGKSVPLLPPRQVLDVGIGARSLGFLTLLPQYKRLRRLHLDLMDITTEDSELTETENLPVSHPSLRSLDLSFSNKRGDYEGGLENILDSLHAPELQSFSVKSVAHGSDVWSSRGFREFLLRSACNLTSLKLDGLDMEEGELSDILKLVPSLKTFRWSDLDPPEPETMSQAEEDYTYDSVLYDLMEPDTVLPCLEHLDLWVRCRGVEDAAISDIVVRRASTLKTFRLHMIDRNPENSEPYNNFAFLHNEGFHAEVIGCNTKVRLCSCKGIVSAKKRTTGK